MDNLILKVIGIDLKLLEGQYKKIYKFKEKIQ